MEFRSQLTKLDSNVWEYILRVPNPVAEVMIEGQNRRIVSTFNHTISVNNSIMYSGDGYFILVNQKIRDQLGLKPGDDVQVRVEKDRSKYGFHLPESFEALMEQDETGSAHFDALTPGRQRSLIYLINQVRNVDSQINKGLAILSHLTEEKGKLDYKKLNQRIKEYNQRGNLKNGS